MARDPLLTWFFVLIVVRDADGRFLVLQERKHGQLWYLPAGRVEPGETFGDAAMRETREETGVLVQVDGIIRIEHTPYDDGTVRCRVLLTAHAVDDSQLIQQPNDDALQARWATLDEIRRLPLRSPEVVELFDYVQRGAPIYPVTIITYEGAAFDV